MYFDSRLHIFSSLFIQKRPGKIGGTRSAPQFVDEAQLCIKIMKHYKSHIGLEAIFSITKISNDSVEKENLRPLFNTNYILN